MSVHAIAESKPIRALPHDHDAEQALLGCILFDNACVDRLDGLRAEHFYEGVHASIFAAVEKIVGKSALAEPVVVADTLKSNAAFQEVGALRYLADLVDYAPPVPTAPALASIIKDHAIRRAIIQISEEGLVEAETGEAPAHEQVQAIEHRLFDLAEHGKTSQGFQSFSTALTGAIEMAAEAYSRDGGLSGISTGLMDLDQKLGGMHASDLIILAARPSMGKTALACNVAFQVAKKYASETKPDGSRKTVSGGVVAFFSLEMSAEQLAMRLVADVSGVPSDKIRTGKITAQEFGLVRDASAEINSAPLYIDDTGGLSIAKLSARARRLKRTSGLDLIVVDYLQLVTASSTKRSDNRVQEVSEITQALKALAKDLQVPVLALSQLSRQVESREDKRPQLSDLRESGSIEQDADVVMFIYRESYYLSRTEPREGSSEHMDWCTKMDAARGFADIIISKQRHGPIGTVRAHFNEELTRFSDLAHEDRFSGYGARKPYGDD